MIECDQVENLIYGNRMQLLVTNDDGIDAHGLAALVDAVRNVGTPIVVAPNEQQSGCSHSVTTGKPVRMEPRGRDRYAIFGTPADCVRVGLSRITPEARWVLAGINHGGNLGADVYYSGTVAAVREAVLHGWPGIAVSYYKKKHLEYDWSRVIPWVTKAIASIMEREPEPGVLWNINLPHIEPTDPDPAVVYCKLDPHPLPLSFRHGEDGMLYDGDYHSRQRGPETDVDCCFGGRIAVTQIRLF